MSAPSDYGDRYYGIQIGPAEFTYVHADRVEVSPSGALLVYGRTFRGRKEGLNDQFLYALPPGIWLRVFAASALDGRPLCVEAGDVDE